MIGVRNNNFAAKKVHNGTNAIQWNKVILARFYGHENRINVWHGGNRGVRVVSGVSTNIAQVAGAGMSPIFAGGAFLCGFALGGGGW